MEYGSVMPALCPTTNTILKYLGTVLNIIAVTLVCTFLMRYSEWTNWYFSVADSLDGKFCKSF